MSARAATADPPSEDDEALLLRLRDLTVVDLEVLLRGASEPTARALLEAHIDDLADALRGARERMRALLGAIAGGPTALSVIDASGPLRAQERARAAAARDAEGLRARADACRALARLDELAARVLPRLLAAERRRVAS